MREFEGGATRDNNEGKNDYEGFLSPLVIEAYGNYMNKHRKQADGNLRDSDNWQNHFGVDHFKICMKSLMRHLLDLWFLHRGFKRFDKIDNHEITKEEACCAIKFNVNAYLDKLLKDAINNSCDKKMEFKKIQEDDVCRVGQKFKIRENIYKLTTLTVNEVELIDINNSNRWGDKIEVQDRWNIRASELKKIIGVDYFNETYVNKKVEDDDVEEFE